LRTLSPDPAASSHDLDWTPQLTAVGQQFADAAGNAYLKAPGVFVLITDRKPED